MKGKDILIGLSYIDEKYVEEANRETVIHELPGVRPLRRAMLIAAIITVMLALVGCAVVYLLNLQEIKLGEQEVTYDVFDYDPDNGEAVAYVGQDTMTQQVLTLAGMRNSPASQAAREWYEFREAYDPDRAIQHEAWGNEPEFPAEYYGYGLYSQEMKDKLDEILEKYDLKLRGQEIGFPTSRLLFKALGVESVQNPGSEAKLKVTYADFYANGNLDVGLNITVPNGEGVAEKANGYLRYRSKDCFIPDTAVLTEGQWEEWNYTTTNGDEVLLLRSQDAGAAWIFCDRPDYAAALQMDIIRDVHNETRDGELVPVFDLMTVEQLKLVADAIDFSLEPKLVDGWENLDDGAVAIGQEINGYRIDVESAFTDGFAYRIVLKITAPEGVAIVDPENHNHRVDPSTGHWGRVEEDGDGRLNTCHYILQESIASWNRPEDGSYVFPQGHVVPIYWQDMVLSIFDPETATETEEVLTEGVWKFDVPLNDADLREIEFVNGPVTAQGAVGFMMDGTDVLEELEIASIKLRTLGITADCVDQEKNGDFFFFNGKSAYLGLTDGTKVENNMIGYDPVDLDMVAYLCLADGTVLPAPGMEEITDQLLQAAALEAAEVPQVPTFEDGIELLPEPIMVKNLAGYATDATGDMEPLYEYFRVSSFILHPDGAVVWDKRAFEAPDTVIQVVMQDGSQIALKNTGCGRDADNMAYSTFASETTIDLTQVDYLILPDTTEIPVP